jgi:hypothetical protein
MPLHSGYMALGCDDIGALDNFIQARSFPRICSGQKKNPKREIFPVWGSYLGSARDEAGLGSVGGDAARGN